MIIPLEKQVCALEYSQELRKLGVKQDSLWWWVHNKVRDEWKVTFLTQCCKDHPESWDYYSAFIVAELGEMLYDATESTHFSWSSSAIGEIEGKTKWSAIIHKYQVRQGNWIDIEAFLFTTEADCRAKMLIWFIKNKKVVI